MKEIYGRMWKYYGQPGYQVLITTNGFVRNDGCAVMGRGCALQAAQRIPSLPKLLGESLKKHGNVVRLLHPGGKSRNTTTRIITFPVKNNWYEDADPELIRQSALALKEIAEFQPETKFILPRPGCGNGRLKWNGVKHLLKDLPDNVWVIAYERERDDSK